MKYILIFSSLFFSSFNILFGQHKFIAKVSFEFEHIDDTTQRANPYVEDIIVYLSENASLQRSLVAQRIKSNVEDFVKNPKRQVNVSGVAVFESPKVNKDISRYDLLLDERGQHAFLYGQIFDTEYKMPIPYPEMQWKLLDDQKQIDGYLCQKAECQFAGRTYVAWFTSEIPFPFGPWKLHGLPGMILEAEDSTHSVKWNYTAFEKIEENNGEKVTVSEEAISTTISKFNKIFESTAKNPVAAQKAASIAARSTGKMGLMMHNIYITNYKVGKLKKEGFTPKRINNPLELN